MAASIATSSRATNSWRKPSNGPSTTVARRWRPWRSRPHDPLAAVIDAYLSISHRDNLGTSCAVTTLARDVSHSSPRARTAYTDQVGIYIDMLVRLLPPGPGSRATAITALSTLVGAVSMARAVNDEALSREILASAESEMKAQLRAVR